jgi:hypothetical protein
VPGASLVVDERLIDDPLDLVATLARRHRVPASG